MKNSDISMKRYTLLRRSGGQPAGAPAPEQRPRVRRLTLVRRAQSWAPLPAPARSPQP